MAFVESANIQTVFAARRSLSSASRCIACSWCAPTSEPSRRNPGSKVRSHLLSFQLVGTDNSGGSYLAESAGLATRSLIGRPSDESRTSRQPICQWPRSHQIEAAGRFLARVVLRYTATAVLGPPGCFWYSPVRAWCGESRGAVKYTVAAPVACFAVTNAASRCLARAMSAPETKRRPVTVEPNGLAHDLASVGEAEASEALNQKYIEAKDFSRSEVHRRLRNSYSKLSTHEPVILLNQRSTASSSAGRLVVERYARRPLIKCL